MKTTFSIFNYQFSIARMGLLALSFLLLSSCCNFPENNNTMAFITNIPGGTVQLSGNDIFIEGETTRTGTGVNEQKVLLRVTSTDGALPGGPWIDSIAGTTATFNISALVDTVFNYQFDYAASAQVVAYDLLAANITVEVGDQWTDNNGDINQAWSGVTDAMVILKGKLPRNELATLVANGETFYSFYITDKRFLTNAFLQSTQYYYLNDPSHWLKLWIYFPDAVYYNPSLVIRYTDGTVSNEFPITISNPSTTKLYEINAHVAVMANKVAEKDIDNYEIRVNDLQGGFRMIAYVSNKYSEVHEEILIKNHLGAVEVLHCYGNLETTKQVQKQTFTTPQVTPSIFNGTVISQVQGKTDQYKCNTGIKTLHERKWIAQLLESDLAWWKSERLLRLSGKEYGIAPINILPGSFNVDLTSEDLLPIEFEFKIAHND